MYDWRYRSHTCKHAEALVVPLPIMYRKPKPPVDYYLAALLVPLCREILAIRSTVYVANSMGYLAYKMEGVNI